MIRNELVVSNIMKVAGGKAKGGILVRQGYEILDSQKRFGGVKSGEDG